jgi:hypothetical protein
MRTLETDVVSEPLQNNRCGIVSTKSYTLLPRANEIALRIRHIQRRESSQHIGDTFGSEAGIRLA